jgi:hypothetical protein
MEHPIRWAALALACTLVACKREAPIVTPTPGPGPTNAAPSTASAPQPAAPAPPSAPAAAPVATAAITSATLGNAINADKRVTAATDTFRPADTIFVTVETSGSSGAILTARWTFYADGQATRVNEETQKVPPGGPSVTEFHIRKPDGWPRGDYQVVVLVNDEVSVTKKFSVK